MPVLTPFSDSDFPLSIIHEYRISTKSRIIYINVILFIIITFTSLPFINIPVSVKCGGVIQTGTVRFDLVTPVNGRILRVLMRDNQKVVKGDTLLLMDASVATHQASLLKERALLLNQFLTDISCLLKYSENFEIDELEISLQTDLYNASLRQFLQEVRTRKNTIEQRERIFKRYDYLYRSKVITSSEFEKFKFEYDQAVSDHLLLTKRYRSQWQTDATAYREEIRKLKGEKAAIDQQRKLYTIISPYNGSIQNIKPLEVGGYAFANQKIAEISPDGKLKAYCYIKPSDIGMIKIGQQVSFQVDAYNYNTWGLLSGKVLEISDDLILLNSDIPVFKIQCSLDKDHFELAGSRAYLRKGLSFTARFNTGDRNLFQLLRDKADELIDPDFKKRG